MAREKDREPLEPTVGLAQVQDLISQLLAKADPITAAQLQAFTQRPSGPIVPEACIKSWCVSDEYGDNRGGLDKKPVIDIISDVSGKCYLLTSDTRDLVVLRIDDGHRYRLRDNDNRSLVYRRTWFLGMTGEAVPVVMASEASMISDADLATVERIAAERSAWLCIGERVALIQGVGACAWLPDDQLVFERHCYYGKTNEPWRTVESIEWRSGRLSEAKVLPSAVVFRYFAFGMSSRGRVVTIEQAKGEQNQTVNYLDRRSAGIGVPYGDTCHGVAFVDEPKQGVYLLVSHENGGTRILRWYDGVRLTYEMGELPRCVEDGAKFAQLPDGRFAYVARLRHGKRVYVVDGDFQDGCFDLVSNIVQINGKLHYYGVAGRHIFLMKVV